MSNPLRAYKVESTLGPEAAPSAFFEIEKSEYAKEYEQRRAHGRDIASLQRQLEGLDMEPVKSFYLDPRLSIDPKIMHAVKAKPAEAKTGKASLRIRSVYGFECASAMYRLLPEEGLFTKSAIKARMEDKFYADGGAEWTVQRIVTAYPKLGSQASHPVTQAEARAALDRCGLRVNHLPRSVLRAYPLVSAGDGAQAITLNPVSDNGYPVGGKWRDVGAAEKILGLAVGIQMSIDEAAKEEGGVGRWKRREEDNNPGLMALKGKAKADYYRLDQIGPGKMRFYNTFPRQIIMNMQTVTQPFEAQSRSLFDESGTHSGIGISLVRGGAERLVVELDAQLLDGRRGDLKSAYVHVGDDSWVVVRDGKDLVQFALDCSSFDLTQQGPVTKAVHMVLREQLANIDAPAADLWYEYARERIVVVAGSLVRRWKHAGPSGMPLQSKINDMLMDVLITRVLEGFEPGKDEGWWNDHIHREGEKMGFVVKVEQYSRTPAESLREVLEEVPFLFIGYYFHVRNGKVQAFTDLPRTMSQMPYPGLKWVKEDKELLEVEAIRLGSMLFSAGIPPVKYQGVYDAWYAYAVELLEKAAAVSNGANSDRLRWAVGAAVHGPDIEPNVKGLLAAVRRGPDKLWAQPEPELFAESRLVSKDFSWADEAEDEAQQEVLDAGGKPVFAPGRGRLPKPIFLTGRKSTHPVTVANDGRPPPTAVWGPDKAPRPRGGNRRVWARQAESEASYGREQVEIEEFWDDFNAEDGFGERDDESEFGDRNRDEYGNYY